MPDRPYTLDTERGFRDAMERAANIVADLAAVHRPRDHQCAASEAHDSGGLDGNMAVRPAGDRLPAGLFLSIYRNLTEARHGASYPFWF